MSAKNAVVAVALVAIVGALLWRADRPAVYEDDTLSFHYPAAWPKPEPETHPKRPERVLVISKKDAGLRDPQADILERPSAGQPPPVEFLLQIYASDRMISTAAVAGKGVRVGTRGLPGGITAASLEWTANHETLDVGPKALQPGPEYLIRYLAFDHNGRRYQISYTLPSGRLARWRHERIFERMLDTLRFKR